MAEPTYSKYYQDFTRAVIKVRDCLDGEYQVKQQGQLYLPKPDGLDAVQYAAYKDRAMFLGVAERALSGLCGIALRRDPMIALPERLVPMIERMDLEGNSIDMLVEWTLRETLSVGYSCLLLDMPRHGNTVLTTPHVVRFDAEDVIDFKFDVRDGRRKLT